MSTANAQAAAAAEQQRKLEEYIDKCVCCQSYTLGGISNNGILGFITLIGTRTTNTSIDMSSFPSRYSR